MKEIEYPLLGLLSLLLFYLIRNLKSNIVEISLKNSSQLTDNNKE